MKTARKPFFFHHVTTYGEKIASAVEDGFEVAKDQILAQIDHLLGEVNVRRQEVEDAFARAQQGLDRLTHGRIEVQVELARISDNYTSADEEVAQAEEALKRLQQLLGQKGEVVIAGETYTSTQLKVAVFSRRWRRSAGSLRRKMFHVDGEGLRPEGDVAVATRGGT